jgi:2-methylcitrate dehydratase PrpD
VKPEHFTEESIRDPEIASLAERTRLAELAEAPLLTARLELRMKSGETLVEAVDVPTGDPVEKPLSRDDIIEKFRANVAFSGTVSRANSERALELLERLEELDNVDRIVKLLVV